MNLLTCKFALLLLAVQCSFSYSPQALDYILRSIEFRTHFHSGVFQCVFYDISANNSYDNILSAILKSPRLNHVLKYVVNGTYQEQLEQLPRTPTLLLVHPGYNVEYLLRNETQRNMFEFMQLFDPTTNVIFFVNFSNRYLLGCTESLANLNKYAHSVYFDDRTMHCQQCNGVWCWQQMLAPNPLYLFEFGRRWMKGRDIIYIKNDDSLVFAWNWLWMNETARYLNTVGVEFRHDCNGTGIGFLQCIKKFRKLQKEVDIMFTYMVSDGIPRNFRHLFTSIPLFMRIGVPKDRPLNAVELMLMPLNWRVWALLLVILAASELAIHFFPNLFKNNPFLLVVCGFERRNLHLVSQWEKMVLLSLTIVMFFMSNAFETKIVSLMISKPSIQRIKTLSDRIQSDLKFVEDLANNPYPGNNSVLGKIAVQGNGQWISEVIPGSCTIWYSDWADLYTELAFDYQLKQLYYILLDYEHYNGPELYQTSWRSPLLDAFRYIHLKLVEAGLIDLWKFRWKARMRSKFVGHRPREDVRNKSHLNFDDMKPAWVVLAIGFGVAAGGKTEPSGLVGNASAS